MGRMLAEGMMPQIVERHSSHGSAIPRCHARALPDLPDGELLWRVHFMIGAMAHTMHQAPIFPHMAEVLQTRSCA